MIVYVMFDKVARQFTPTFEQPTNEAAVRALKRDASIMSSVEDFLIASVFFKSNPESSDINFENCVQLCDFKWVPLKEFLCIDDHVEVSN